MNYTTKRSAMDACGACADQYPGHLRPGDNVAEELAGHTNIFIYIYGRMARRSAAILEVIPLKFSSTGRRSTIKHSLWRHGGWQKGYVANIGNEWLIHRLPGTMHFESSRSHCNIYISDELSSGREFLGMNGSLMETEYCMSTFTRLPGFSFPSGKVVVTLSAPPPMLGSPSVLA
jgi:hypothetical protein